MTTTWILVANASEAHLYAAQRAKLFNSSSNSTLSSVNDFIHPESREKGINLVADRSGHSGHGTFVESSDPKQVEADRFAKELAVALEQGRVSNQFQDLIIAAPAKFRGLLHKYINSQLDHLVSVNINRDYTKNGTKVLVKHLQEHL